MKRITLGILAHVDAGKTTCIESMLYTSGTIKKAGRVDHGDAFLDFDEQERDRGITIYSKEAFFTWKDTEIYVIDTPGHVDFSSEMERCLQVLDLAVILINGQDGVQSHTETIWNCLEHYHVPAIIFVNKMDISYRTKEELMNDLIRRCSDSCVDFSDEDRWDKIAMSNEEIMETYLETGEIPDSMIQQAVYRRECFPVLFGSALKMTGISELMDTVSKYSLEKEYGDEFGARVYKIDEDEQGNRLTHIKITGGVLKAKQKITEHDKADQIRLYSGRNYRMLNEAYAGMVCALKGPETLESGMGLGFEKDHEQPLLSAYLDYQLVYPSDTDVLALTEYCKVLASEDPQLEISVDEDTKKIHLRIMGEMQMEVLQKKIRERCGISVGFGTGKVIYRETIRNSVIGVGHFEPLRHYAEVVVRLDPLPRGSGIVCASECPADMLSIGWQKSVLSQLENKWHRGVLTGSLITDVKITLLAAKAHLKHTEGGDFRQASSRAVRQGLKKADSILLEPYYAFELTVPEEVLGRALFELDSRHAEVEIEEGAEGYKKIKGRGPVRLLMNYQNEVTAFTRGKGRFSCALDGYYPSPDQAVITAEFAYDSESDLRNPTGSVFCAHGSGYFVPWNEVEEHMHIEMKTDRISSGYRSVKQKIDDEELKRVFEMSQGRNRNDKKKEQPKKKKIKEPEYVQIREKLPRCLIVDGYNMIYSWERLKEEGKDDISTAREHLIDLLMNYQGYTGCRMIIVFDGYKVRDNIGSSLNQGNATVVYTRSGQTADSYIEKASLDLKNDYDVVVATSDALIQNAALAHGAMRMSARELENIVMNASQILNRDMPEII